MARNQLDRGAVLGLHFASIVCTTHGAVCDCQLPRELSQSIGQLGRQEQATTFMTLLAAFQAFLHRYSGQEDVIVGSPLADNGQNNEGRAFVYRGSLSGLVSPPAWTTESNQADAEYGSSVGTAA